MGNGHEPVDNDLPHTCRRYPRVVVRDRGAVVLWIDQRTAYDVPPDPAGFLGTLDQISRKTWMDSAFVSLAVRRVAEAKGWDIGVR